jgi:hypothetical protein
MKQFDCKNHHIIGCVYSKEVWNILLSKLHLQDVVLVQEEKVLEWWLRSRKLVDKQVRKGFDSLFFLVRWTLWKERNARTFNGTSTAPASLALKIQEEANEWCLAGYKQLLSLLALARCCRVVGQSVAKLEFVNHNLVVPHGRVASVISGLLLLQNVLSLYFLLLLNEYYAHARAREKKKSLIPLKNWDYDLFHLALIIT